MEKHVDSFNKELFSELLLKIKGNRTLTRFAEETCTSIAHLSRMINKKLDSAPSPETLKKLLSKNQGDVTYQELMIAAGYINGNPALKDLMDNEEDPLENTNSPHSQEEIKKFKSLCMSTLLFNLSCRGHSWLITKGKDITLPGVNEFTLDLINSSLKAWTFDIIFAKLYSKNNLEYKKNLRMYVVQTWGRLASKALGAGSKYSLVMENEDLYNAFKDNAPVNFNLALSIILVVPEELKVLKEENLCYPTTEDINKMSLFSF